LRIHTPRLGLRLGALIITAAIAACSGSVNTTPLAPASSQAGTTSTTSNTTLPSASSGGITSNVTLPPTSSSTTITESVSVHPFGSTPILSTARSAQSASRSPQAATAPFPLLYVQFVSSSSVTIDGTPGVSFTLPSITAGTSYFLASYGPGGWTYPAEGPGSVSGTTVSFPISVGSNTIAISPTNPVEVALYALTGPALTPTTLTFSAGSPTSAPFTVTEPGATAAFTAAISCATASPAPTPTAPSSNGPASEIRVESAVTPSPSPSPAFVAQLGATSATPTGGVATFTVISGTQPGACSVVVTDAQSASSTETVDVGQTSLGIYSVDRNAAQGGAR
jgi:hypothetical protein